MVGAYGLCRRCYEDGSVPLPCEPVQRWAREDLVAEARLLLGTRTDEQVAEALGVTCAAIARSAYRVGDTALGARFDAAYRAPQRKARAERQRERRHARRQQAA